MGKGKFASNFTKIKREFLAKGSVRSQEAQFMLELLESGSSREELESIMDLTLHDSQTVLRYVGKYYHHIFRLLEDELGFGSSLRVGLQLRLLDDHDKKCYAKKLAYPAFLVFTAYSVLSLFLFAIRPTIDRTRASLGMNLGVSNELLQAVFVFLSIFFLILMILLFYRFHFHKISMYRTLHRLSSKNAWTIMISKRFSLLYRELYIHGLSTREIIAFLSKINHQPILTNIAHHMQIELESGKMPDRSIEDLDPFLARILKMESHPDFVQKLMQYSQIAQKRFEFNVEKIAYGMTIFAYVSIIVLVLVLYQEIMFPLQMLQGMN